MYAKIQKGKTQSYMIIQSNAQITTNARACTGSDVWDYMIAQQETCGHCGDDDKNAKFAACFLETLGVDTKSPFIILTEVGKLYSYGNPNCELSTICNLSIAHVNVDGVSYLTEGNIYILNDNGQTIQKI